MRVADRGEGAGRGLAVGDVEHEPSRVRREELLERLGPLAAAAVRAHLCVEREQRALQVAARHLAVARSRRGCRPTVAWARTSGSATFAAHAPSGAPRSTSEATDVVAPIVIVWPVRAMPESPACPRKSARVGAMRPAATAGTTIVPPPITVTFAPSPNSSHGLGRGTWHQNIAHS